jgi:hypothetical protein
MTSTKQVVMALGDQQACGGVIFTELSYNGHFLDLVGLLGDDRLIGFTGGETDLHGNDGNDTLISFNPGGRLVGNRGSDYLFNLSIGLRNTLLGGEDNDCLRDDNGATEFFECQSGELDIEVRPVPVNSRGCEFTRNECPER